MCMLILSYEVFIALKIYFSEQIRVVVTPYYICIREVHGSKLGWVDK